MSCDAAGSHNPLLAMYKCTSLSSECSLSEKKKKSQKRKFDFVLSFCTQQGQTFSRASTTRVTASAPRNCGEKEPCCVLECRCEMSLLTFRPVSLENTPDASSALIGVFACGDAVVTRAEDDKMNHMHERIIKNKSDLRLAVSRIGLHQPMVFLIGSVVHSLTQFGAK